MFFVEMEYVGKHVSSAKVSKGKTVENRKPSYARRQLSITKRMIVRR